MEKSTKINTTIDYLQQLEGRVLSIDNNAILLKQNEGHDRQILPIRILSVLGGFFSTIAFFGFLFILGIHKSEIGLFIFGSASMLTALFLSKRYKKIYLDIVSVSTYCIGLGMILFGLYEVNLSNQEIHLICIIISLISITLTNSYILTFITSVILHNTIFSWIFSTGTFGLFHINCAILVFGICGLFLYESKLISSNKAVAQRYRPFRTATILAFIGNLVLLNLEISNKISLLYFYATSVICILAILFTASTLIQRFAISSFKNRAIIYLTIIVALAPTVLTPGISGAILLLLLSFTINYKTGFILGIATFPYFISQFYYDLNFTLLTKSIILFSSGILLILFFLFISNYFESHEKI